jgi:DNA-directed RNA polymerase specialized sigma24 family protein
MATGGDLGLCQMNNIVDPQVGEEELDDSSQLDEIDNAMIFRSILEMVRSKFRANTWQCFWLTVIEDQNSADVAKELGLTAEAVRKNKSRVIARLREVMESHLI